MTNTTTCCERCDKSQGFRDCADCPCHTTICCEVGGLYGKDNDKSLHFYCEFCDEEMEYSEIRTCKARNHTSTCCQECFRQKGNAIWCGNLACECHKVLTQGDYHKHDHSHCWESKNPPCGQKIKHFECCLCKELNPDVFRFSGGGGGNSKKNWGEDRKNLYDFLQKFPHRGFDVIDSAYLAGLDARSAELHQERQRFGRELLEKVKGMVINKLKPRNRYDENGKHINLDTIDYDQACDDILEELEKLPNSYNL